MTEKTNNKGDNIFFLAFLYIVSFWSMIKFLFLYYILKKGTEDIRKEHYGSLFVDVFSCFNRGVRINATNWRALDLLYNHEEKLKESPYIEKLLSKFWLKMENFQAIQDRALLVKKETREILKALIEKAKKRGGSLGLGKIKILSIASGSAQPLLEAIGSLNEYQQRRIEVVLLDLDSTALENSKKVAKKFKVKSELNLVHASAHDIEKIFLPDDFDFIEMVGFLDYRPKDKAVILMKRIRKILKSGGSFVTCNICPNKEKIFLDWVLLWPMIYRTKNELRDILIEAGFSEQKISFLCTKFKIHQLAVCQK